LRVGQGFDVHKLEDAGKLILGGVEIDYPKGLEGHSDADVLTHAVIDALLGAAALGDIGMHFPDTDPAYKDASSIEMLETICSAISALGFRINGIDVTLIAQSPRIGPYRPRMVDNLATAAGIEPELVNVKATSTEGLGFPGRGEGIAAMAVAVLAEGRSLEEGER
jgi:2-C-methyl-D-erythritol 2,4-cyclodiphosphate synthase